MGLLVACKNEEDPIKYKGLESRLGGKFHPGIYRWNLPVFPGMANKSQVANTGK